MKSPSGSLHQRQRRRARTLSAVTLLSAGLAGSHAHAQTRDSKEENSRATTAIGQVQEVVVTTGMRGEQRTVADCRGLIKTDSSIGDNSTIERYLKYDQEAQNV